MSDPPETTELLEHRVPMRDEELDELMHRAAEGTEAWIFAMDQLAEVVGEHRGILYTARARAQ